MERYLLRCPLLQRLSCYSKPNPNPNPKVSTTESQLTDDAVGAAPDVTAPQEQLDLYTPISDLAYLIGGYVKILIAQAQARRPLRHSHCGFPLVRVQV